MRIVEVTKNHWTSDFKLCQLIARFSIMQLKAYKMIMKLRDILGLQLYSVLYAWNQYF